MLAEVIIKSHMVTSACSGTHCSSEHHPQAGGIKRLCRYRIRCSRIQVCLHWQLLAKLHVQEACRAYMVVNNPVFEVPLLSYCYLLQLKLFAYNMQNNSAF